MTLGDVLQLEYGKPLAEADRSAGGRYGLGSRRVMAIRSHALATRTAGSDVSTSMARHSRVNSSTTVSARNTRPAPSSVPFLVVRNVDRDALATVDTGRSRSFAGVLTMRG